MSVLSSLRRMLLAGALVAVGCATTTGVSDQQVARRPPQDRAQIVTAQQSINVAQSNVATARQARAQARQFQRVAGNELAAAQAELRAARTGVDLGRTARDPRVLRAASRREDMARDRMVAARAKLDYADRLADLREAQLNAAEAAARAARSNVEMTKVRLLQQEGIAPSVNLARLRSEHERAQTELADARARVAALEGSVATLRQAWEQRRRAFDSAWAGREPPLRAPPPPALLQQNLPEQRGLATPPVAPQTPQSQPPNGIPPSP